MTKAAKNIIENEENNAHYGIIGNDICMGDHKVNSILLFLLLKKSKSFLLFFSFVFVSPTQPVYLKLRIKTNQGIVNKCDHVQIRQDGCKENYNYEELNSKLVNVCEMCLKHLHAIVVENDTNMKPLPLASQSSNINRKMPPFINVVDADNFNVCLCNVTDEKKSISKDENICPNCRHLIDQQPNERRTLVSKQTMLGDVVVNRIDSQYLSSTYSSSPSELRKLNDPYTPESVESHSPQPDEVDEEKEFPNFINSTNDDDEILVNIREVIKHKHNIINEINCPINNDEADTRKSLQNHFNHTVSPSQLQTRLEILRRESQLDCNSKSSGSASISDSNEKKTSLHSKCCLRCSCAIL